MNTPKKDDFIEVEYTGKLKDTGEVFDTTDKAVAESANIHSDKAEYGPKVFCVGKGQVIDGLDNQFPKCEVGKEATVEISALEGFGNRNAKLIQLIPTAKFKKENINPEPGLQVNIDGANGVIKTVSGGRTLVDFNYPLAGHDLVYTLTVNKILDKVEDKVSALIYFDMGRKQDVTVEGKKASVVLEKELPKEVIEPLTAKIKDWIPAIDEVTFTVKKEQPKEAVSKPAETVSEDPKPEAEKAKLQ